jgi:hypothetical protein
VDTPPDPTAVAREVLEYLLLRLEDADRSQVNLAPPEYHRAAGALFALDRLGLVVDARAWDERLRDATGLFGEVVEDEAAHPRPARQVEPPTLPPATLDEALQNLEHMIEMERRAAETTGREFRELPSYVAAMSVLRTLDAMDLVREEDWRRWTDRFERTARADVTPTANYQADAFTAARIRLERAEASEPPTHPPLVHPEPQCTQAELIDILRVEAAAGASAQPTMLERFSDGVVVSWTAPFEPGSRHSMPHLPRATLADDVGTHYFPGGGGGGGGSAGIVRNRWTQSFAPAVPPDAHELRLTIDDEGFVLKLPA